MRRRPATHGFPACVLSFKSFRCLLLFSFLSLSTSSSLVAGNHNLAGFQQNAPIKGKVTDKTTGEPLSGVSVVVKGTNTGATTDAGGNFSIDAPQNATLEFSIVGYGTVTAKATGNTAMNVSLNRPDASLNEVVVIGYGTQSKKDVIGSIASVGARQLQDRAVVSFGEAIAGQVAGVQVQQASSAPGAGLSIKIRGVGSISADNTPLYVIDGVPLDNTTGSYSAQGATGANVPTNPLASINPGDIQSIDILKDASATSIYGSRGSNGCRV